MRKVKAVDFSDWSVYEGFAEGSGRSEKLWLQSPNGKIGLFKYPKFDVNTLDITTEHISEHLAHRIGNLIEVETAAVDIGLYQNRIGCMSYLINREDEAIVEGAAFITGKHPDYDIDTMQEKSTGKYYCIDHLLEISDSSMVTNKWIQMMIFDYLIGNSDRHQNNWAVLVRYADKEKNPLMGRVCPLYDNGSSLCSYIKESDAEDFLGSNTTRFDALTDTKSRSMIRIDGTKKKHPRHSDVVKALIAQYPYALKFSESIISTMTDMVIENLLGEYDELLSERKLKLIEKFLKRKIELLQQIVKVSL